MRQLLVIVVLSLGSGLAAVSMPALAQAEASTIELVDFYAYPEDASGMNKFAGYVWPDVQRLSALVRVTTAGYDGEQDVELFFVARYRDGEVINKVKQSHPLPAGTHELIVSDFINTADFYGSHTLDLELELALKGAATQHGFSAVDITGPAPPEVAIHAIQVYNPAGGYRDRYFEPGDTLMIEATIEIGDNPAEVPPTVTIFAVMDEEAYVTYPDGDYEAYYKQWGSAEADFASGLFRLRASGWLPHFFAEPWDYYHPFKVYVLVSFGPGAEYADFIDGTVFDSVGGDVRQTDNVEDRLIEISPGYNWEFRRGRAPFDDPLEN